MIILSSGESLTSEEILEAALLLAAHNADFPMLSSRDRHIACVLFVQLMMEHNDEVEVI